MKLLQESMLLCNAPLSCEPRTLRVAWRRSVSFIHFQESLETLTLKLAKYALTFSPFSFYCCGLSTWDFFLFISLLSCMKRWELLRCFPQPLMELLWAGERCSELHFASQYLSRCEILWCHLYCLYLLPCEQDPHFTCFSSLVFAVFKHFNKKVLNLNKDINCYTHRFITGKQEDSEDKISLYEKYMSMVGPSAELVLQLQTHHHSWPGSHTTHQTESILR